MLLLIEAILALDRKLQKPLRQVVADLPRLRAEPRAYLADADVVFGPRRPYAVATVLGVLVGIAVLVVFALAATERPKNQPADPWYFVAAGVCVLGSAAGTIAATTSARPPCWGMPRSC